jgi:cytoskeletal protein RodZ
MSNFSTEAPVTSSSPQVVSVSAQKFGDYLRNCRAESGFSLEDLASKSQVRVQLIQCLENNNFDLGLKPFYLKVTMERIALALDCNADDLLAKLEAELRAQGIDGSDGNSGTDSTRRHTFTPEDMGQVLPKGGANRLPALLISILIASILGLLLVAAAYQKYRARQLAMPETPMQLDLPELLTPREAPLETLEIPSN